MIASIILIMSLTLLLEPAIAAPTENSPKDLSTPKAESPAKIPRMVDYGADKCVPCKAIAPILKELKNEYKDRIEVVFVDVWKDRTAGKKANIKLIPTQIFYDATGKEVSRHEGFMSKEDILTEWRKHKFLPKE